MSRVLERRVCIPGIRRAESLAAANSRQDYLERAHRPFQIIRSGKGREQALCRRIDVRKTSIVGEIRRVSDFHFASEACDEEPRDC